MMGTSKPPSRGIDDLFTGVKTTSDLLALLSSPDGRKNLDEAVSVLSEWRAFTEEMRAGREIHAALEDARSAKTEAAGVLAQARSDAETMREQRHAELDKLKSEAMAAARAKAADLSAREKEIEGRAAALAAREKDLLVRENGLAAREASLERAKAEADKARAEARARLDAIMRAAQAG